MCVCECVHAHIYTHNFLIHSTIPAFFSCFHALDIVNNAAMNIGSKVQISVQVRIFNTLEYILRSRVAGSYGNSILKFFKDPPYCFP